MRKEIYVLASLCIMFGSNTLKAQCTCTENAGSLNANQLVLCENFESYSNGSSFPFNNPRWAFWPGTGTFGRVQTAPVSNSKALLVQHNGNTGPDLLLKLGNRTTGRYRVSWQMYIPKGKTAYYSIQHAESAELWAYEIHFENGIGTLSRFGLPLTKFPYITGVWNRVMQIIDITANEIELWINDEYVDSWNFNTGRGPNYSYILGEYPLAAINFKAEQNASYYVDNICMWQAAPALISNTSPICIKNGRSISGGTSIVKIYNLYTEREYFNESCRNICSFAGLNVKNSLKYDNQDRVPASRIDDASILPNQVLNLPCLKELFPFFIPLTRKEFRGQIYPFTATTTDLSIDLRFQLGSENDVRIALVECNENLNFPCQLDEDSDGLNYYFKVQAGKTYNIVVIAIETVEFLIDISTTIQPKICKQINEDLGTPCICKEATTTLNQSIALSNIMPSPNSATKRVFSEITKDHLGGEKAFRITVDRPGLATFSLSSTNQGYSMFLAGSDCADNLLALNSTPDNGGTATISKVLEAGVYHLVVDQLGYNPSSRFQLTYTVSAVDPVIRAGNSACPINPNNVHQVSIRSTPLLLNTDVLTISDRIYLVNARNNNNRETNAANWNGQQINFALFEDGSTDNLTCGYVDGDLIEFVIIRQNNIYAVKPIFQQEDGVEITATNLFKKGGKSLITGFVSTLNVNSLGVSSIPTLSSREGSFPLEINSTGAWRIQRINPNKPAWVEFNLSSSSGIRDVSVRVLRNQSTETRTDTVLVINDQGFYKSIIFTQPGCTGPSVNAGVDRSECSGQSLTLTATGIGTITWQAPGAVSNPSLTTIINSTQTLTAYATDINGCSASDQITITALPKPTANAGADQSICAGNKATLLGSGGGTYLWDSNTQNAQNAQIEVSPTQTTTYTLSVTQNGCTATDQVVVVVNRAMANAGIDRSICKGSNTLLEASGGGTYLWSNGETNPAFSVSPTSDQVYHVTVTNNACTATASVKVTVIPLPQASAGLSQAICLGESATLVASGGDAYLWNTTDLTEQITVSPTQSTNYTVTVTLNGCSQAAQVSVTVNSASANAGPDQSICLGQQATLTALGTGTYQWSTNATTPSITLTPNQTQTYTLTVTQNNCTATDEAVVTVRALPSISAGADQNICIGQNAELKALGQGIYTWSTRANTPSIIVAPTSTQTFSVTATLEGCEASDEVLVIVNPLPSANAGPDLSICAGQNVVLNASGGSSYRWSTNATTTSITVSPVQTQKYSVTVTQDACEASDEVEVTVKPLPVANAGLDQSICAGQSSTLNASGGDTYRWSTSASTASISVNPLATQIFTVSATKDGCTASDEVLVTVNPLPSANAGPDQSVCAGQGVTLVASGGSTYKWSNNTTAASFSFTPQATQLFSVTVTQDACEATDEVLVTVRPLPSANAGPDLSICAGQSAVLNASGGSSYRWSTNATTTSLTVSPAQTQKYSVTITQNACEASDEVEVTVKPLPVANAGLDQSICAGQSATLNAAGGGTYRWSTSASTASISVNPFATQIFTVSVTQDGCTVSDEVLITVKSLPSANAGPDQSVCAGQDVMLVASGGSTYKWSNNATAASTSFTPLATQLFTVTVTQDACEATDEVLVTVRPLPSANAGPDLSICAGQSVVLNASGGSSYRWSTNTTTTSITVSPVQTQKYSVTVTQDACEASDEVEVTVKPLPVANAGLDQSICAGQSATLNAAGGGTYRWSTGAASSTLTVNPSSTQSYTLAVTLNGCTATDQVIVTVNANPGVKKDSSQFKAGPNSFIAVTVSGGISPYQYQWLRNDTLVSTQEDLRGLKTGIYKLNVKDANGCAAGYGPELFIITATRELAGLLDLKIYPNPTPGQFRIEGRLRNQGAIQVSVIDAMGKYIWKSDVKTANEFLYTPDFSNLAKGMYVVQIEVSGGFEYRKLIVH